jgi:hypothetical protein
MENGNSANCGRAPRDTAGLRVPPGTKARCWLVVFTLGLTFVVWADAGSQRTIYFAADFSKPDANGTGFYNFAGTYPQSGKWTHAHLPTGGRAGGPAAQITQIAGATQYNLGWFTPAFGSFILGDHVYFRFRVKWLPTMRVSNAHNKFLLFGRPDRANQSRVILTHDSEHDNIGATLGWNGNDPSDWGLSASPNTWYEGVVKGIGPIRPHAWSFGLHRNIHGEAGNVAGPVLMTWPGSPLQHLLPGGRGTVGAASTDGWYHVQLYVRSGTAGNAQFKIWVNNNKFETPTKQNLTVTDGLGVSGWSENGAVIGGFADSDSKNNTGYILDSFEAAGTFDSAWYDVARKDE